MVSTEAWPELCLRRGLQAKAKSISGKDLHRGCVPPRKVFFFLWNLRDLLHCFIPMASSFSAYKNFKNLGAFILVPSPAMPLGSDYNQSLENTVQLQHLIVLLPHCRFLLHYGSYSSGVSIANEFCTVFLFHYRIVSYFVVYKNSIITIENSAYLAAICRCCWRRRLLVIQAKRFLVVWYIYYSFKNVHNVECLARLLGYTSSLKRNISPLMSFRRHLSGDWRRWSVQRDLVGEAGGLPELHLSMNIINRARRLCGRHLDVTSRLKVSTCLVKLFCSIF